MTTETMDSVRFQINSCIYKINGQINWCRFQQQLKTVTRDEREGWWTEEAGLMDALLGRNRTAFMKAGHRSQFMRYLWVSRMVTPPSAPGLQIGRDGNKHNVDL
jgi:hypothetical protein